MGTLKYQSYDSGCAIIREKRTGQKRIILYGKGVDEVQYFNLDIWSGWKSMTNAISNVNRISLISLSPYEAYLAGGYSSWLAGSTRNWWIWNPDRWVMLGVNVYETYTTELTSLCSWRFEDRAIYMRREHIGGDFSRIPEDARLLRSCSLL